MSPPVDRPSATSVFHNGPIFTSDSTRPWVTAVVIQDGVVVALGDSADVEGYLRGARDVVDLKGRCLIPGFVDAHVHPIMGGLERLSCDLSGDTDISAYLETIFNFGSAWNDDHWIRGGGWSVSSFGATGPTREMLDDVQSNRPVLLWNRDHHAIWVNSRALELAQITKDTPDPPGGRISRYPNGEPSGLLHEEATALVEAYLPQPTEKMLNAALREAQRYLHSVGITSWQDAMVKPSDHKTYMRAQTEGWLTARVQAALWWPRGITISDIGAQVEEFDRMRSQAYELRETYQAGVVKIMQDGVLETQTAAVIEPYLDIPCGCSEQASGMSFFSEDVLNESVRQIVNAGFSLHFHALGDRAVREALNALALLPTKPNLTSRHHLAHLQMVHPDDIGRFRTLGVTATVQPLWARHHPQVDDFVAPHIGPDRAERQYPFGELRRAGTAFAMGSDWPVSSADPLAGIFVAVNRRSPEAPPTTPPLGHDQSLPLEEVVRAYTVGSARVNHIDHEAGAIMLGHAADLALLNTNPFVGDISELRDTRVVRTYVNGEIVFDAA